MKIVGNNYIINPYLASAKPDCVKIKQQPQQDVFVSSKTKKEINFGSKESIAKRTGKIILKRYPKMTQEVYNKMPKYEKSILGITKDIDSDLMISMALDPTKILIKHFDEKYGKNNYVFVSIGRSLGLIADCMKALGRNSRTMPISGLHGKKITTKEIVAQPNFKNYTRYLREIGLDKNTISNDGRMYIFTDYCATGNTLEVVQKLLTKRLGVNSDNVTFENFETIYEQACKKNRTMVTPYLINLNLGTEYYKIYSPMEELDCLNLGAVYQVVNRPQNESSKYFYFRLYDAIANSKN